MPQSLSICTYNNKMCPGLSPNRGSGERRPKYGRDISLTLRLSETITFYVQKYWFRQSRWECEGALKLLEWTKNENIQRR